MMKKHWLIMGASCLLIAGCSQNSNEEAAPENYSTADQVADVAPEPAAMRAPGISPTAAPGVAFNYRYAFRIPDEKIAAVQEVHAAACEALGISRCRITGMRYQLIDEDEVEAFLAFKLDPIIARKFGKDAISSVEKAKGILVDSEISGTDVGSEISASQRRSSDVNAEIKRLEARLAAKGLGDRERTELQQQVNQLNQQLSSESESRRQGEASLATTPMEFSYSGGEGIAGLGRNPLAGAFDTSVSSFVTMGSFIIMAIGVLLPWAILIFLFILLARSKWGVAVRNWISRKDKQLSQID
ncbi:DUF4349 domain-containing protein [Sphingorhabdus arenilitoris]|uniref:DUF4349 domain-containing protein n=1 Tax=Sphingorhabdus arenilitoris TaxID=1490041 RepID=A0ABV8RFR4_9SPHN